MRHDTTSTNRSNQRPPLPSPRKIDLSERYMVRDWVKALGVTEEELRRAVLRVGTSEDAVRQFLNLEKNQIN